MKKIKKLGMVAIVIAMCALLGVTVWAAESATVDYSYTVEVDNSVFCVGTERTVTVTVKANKALDVNSVGATIALQGCTLVEDSLTVPGMVEEDLWLYFDGDFAWVKDDSVGVNTQILLTFQVTIPEDAAVGDYKIEVKDVILTQWADDDMKTLKAGNTTEDATVTIKAHEYVAEEGSSWTGEAGARVCTVNGKCACGATTTATANATGTVKDPATCTAKGNTTYTATFAEEWVGIRTHTLTDIPALGHDFGEVVNAESATCTAQGNHAYKQCAECEKFFAADAAEDSKDGENSADTFVIAAHGHTFGEVTAAQSATCEAPGNAAYKQCETCEKYFAEGAETTATDGKDDTTSFVTAQLDHSYTGQIKNDGETHSYQCVNGCNLYGDAVGHTYTDGECVCGAEEPAPAGVKGDVNGDGLVNSADLTVLARHVGGIELITDEAALANADVNGDGEINSADLTKHARYVGGIITDWSQE